MWRWPQPGPRHFLASRNCPTGDKCAQSLAATVQLDSKEGVLADLDFGEEAAVVVFKLPAHDRQLPQLAGDSPLLVLEQRLLRPQPVHRHLQAPAKPSMSAQVCVTS